MRYKLYSGSRLVASGDNEGILDALTKELAFWAERGYGFVDVTKALPGVVCAFIAVAEDKSNVLLRIEGEPADNQQATVVHP